MKPVFIWLAALLILLLVSWLALSKPHIYRMRMKRFRMRMRSLSHSDSIIIIRCVEVAISLLCCFFHLLSSRLSRTHLPFECCEWNLLIRAGRLFSVFCMKAYVDVPSCCCITTTIPHLFKVIIGYHHIRIPVVEPASASPSLTWAFGCLVLCWEFFRVVDEILRVIIWGWPLIVSLSHSDIETRTVVISTRINRSLEYVDIAWDLKPWKPTTKESRHHENDDDDWIVN